MHMASTRLQHVSRAAGVIGSVCACLLLLPKQLTSVMPAARESRLDFDSLLVFPLELFWLLNAKYTGKLSNSRLKKKNIILTSC